MQIVSIANVSYSLILCHWKSTLEDKNHENTLLSMKTKKLLGVLSTSLFSQQYINSSVDTKIGSKKCNKQWTVDTKVFFFFNVESPIWEK